MIEQIIFTLVVLITFGIAARKYRFLFRNIRLGKAGEVVDDKVTRLKNVLLIAFGQKKMFKRPLAAFLHLFIYVAFLFTQIELIEIFVDGFFHQHRFFFPLLGGFYTLLISFIEILSVGVLIASFVFLARRNLLKVPRFVMSEMSGWPKLDGNLILYAEILLVTFIFMMNSADMARHAELGFLVSGSISSVWAGMDDASLHMIERIGWWGHILVVFAFINYLPYSKHLHILFAFPNTYYARLNTKGELANMPDVQSEVASMFDQDQAFAGIPECTTSKIWCK